MAGPLAGVKVLDLSRVLAGPWAGQLLADLGADVIKVERPGAGDDTRGWGPPYLKDKDGNETGEAGYYLSANRGKRSIAIDISKPEGQAVIHKLARRADVLLENYKVGGLKKYGLDFESLKAECPGLVYCSVTGFGQTGPYADRAGYDFMIQAMGGLMSITGERDDKPGGGPQKVGVAVSDLTTGLYGVIGILAALRHRDLTGEGQHIDMALLDVTLGLLGNQNMNWFIGGNVPKRAGNAHANIVPYQDFATADGHIILAAGNDRQFKAFCEVAGDPALAENPRFATNRARVENREAVVPLVAALIAKKTTAEWIAILEDVAVPCGPINTIPQAFADPQVVSRGLAFELDHPLSGKVPQVACPIKFSGTPIVYEKAPPMLGQHSDEILGELGFNAEEIGALKSGGAIG
ncbi:CaiB/BaiF CoA transferase family protein [Gimibacter soli]|uniref:CaiB/BaiF CoA-transferase family protein n=1 Tax=Gimibacter soli TaxID=3024400 RepID=A0AAE9XP53_9PROT|nr:CaiB/BaiF CoA-transferase family protein [Gimibacter soli]WCL53756.1 CaiB/BaiF CoA-transferase family protein [Gimibacter soli]